MQAEKKGTGIAEYKMKNKAGNKQNRDQYERFINHAQQSPPESRCGNFIISENSLTGRSSLFFG